MTEVDFLAAGKLIRDFELGKEIAMTDAQLKNALDTTRSVLAYIEERDWRLSAKQLRQDIHCFEGYLEARKR